MSTVTVTVQTFDAGVLVEERTEEAQAPPIDQTQVLASALVDVLVEAESVPPAALAAKFLAGRDGDDEAPPYVAPTGYHDAYPNGYTVTHNGAVWTSTRDGATGVPGESVDWRQVADEGEILPWVQPHAGSEYPVGAVVTHNGRTWRNDLGAVNGWEPGATGSQWTDIGPA